MRIGRRAPKQRVQGTKPVVSGALYGVFWDFFFPLALEGTRGHTGMAILHNRIPVVEIHGDMIREYQNGPPVRKKGVGGKVISNAE